MPFISDIHFCGILNATTSENEEVDSSKRGSLISLYLIISDEFGSISETCKSFRNENLFEPDLFLYEAANIQMS